MEAPLIDVGSGGGFPAIPLGVLGIAPVTLVEAAGKKAAFLRRAAHMLELAVEVLNDRAEVVGHDPRRRETYRSATARAVGPASTVLELTAPFLAIGGAAVLQRGPEDGDELDALANAAPMLGCALERVENAGQGRTIALVRKVRATPSRFPRRVGIPAKRPLCARFPVKRNHRKVSDGY